MRSSDRGLPRLLVLLALCVLGVACARGPDSEYDPRPLRLVPAWGLNTEPVPVVIEGENFLAVATQHIGGRVPLTMDAHFEAFLGEVALEDVTWVDSRTLRAQVPRGLEPGWHTLVVAGPMGGRVELPRAYFSSERTLARLDAWAELEGAQAWVGDRIPLQLWVENRGGTVALAVTPMLHFSGEGKVEVLSAPQPVDVDPGKRALFKWALRATAPGELRFALEAGGSEATSGVELRAPGVELGPLRVRNRAVLSATLTPSPPVINVGQRVTVSLRVSNTGETEALDVVPDVPLVEGSLAVRVSGPEPRRVNILPGESHEFIWTYISGSVGGLIFHAGAEGRDAHSEVAVRAPRVRSVEVIVQWPGSPAVLVRRRAVLPRLKKPRRSPAARGAWRPESRARAGAD